MMDWSGQYLSRKYKVNFTIFVLFAKNPSVKWVQDISPLFLRWPQIKMIPVGHFQGIRFEKEPINHIVDVHAEYSGHYDCYICRYMHHIPLISYARFDNYPRTWLNIFVKVAIAWTDGLLRYRSAFYWMIFEGTFKNVLRGYVFFFYTWLL